MRGIGCGVSLVLLAGMVLTEPLAAQGRVKVVPAGKSTVLGGFFNCTSSSSAIAAPIGATASNGTVTLQDGTSNRCGNPNQPVRNVVYTPKPEYRGPDTVYIYNGGPRPMEERLIVQ